MWLYMQQRMPNQRTSVFFFFFLNNRLCHKLCLKGIWYKQRVRNKIKQLKVIHSMIDICKKRKKKTFKLRWEHFGRWSNRLTLMAMVMCDEWLSAIKEMTAMGTCIIAHEYNWANWLQRSFSFPVLSNLYLENMFLYVTFHHPVGSATRMFDYWLFCLESYSFKRAVIESDWMMNLRISDP